MPRFSLGALLMLWSRRRGPIALVAYGRLPFYLRALLKVTQLSEPRLVRGFSVLSGFVIEKIRHEEKVPDYPAINMRAMEAVVPATLGLEAEMRGSRWTILAGRLIGEEEAVALALQTIAHQWIWPQLLQIMVSAAVLPAGQNLYIVALMGWPKHWNGALQGAIPETEVRFFEWPRWYSSLYGFFRAIYVTASAFALAVILVLRQNLRKRTSGRQEARLLCEFIDPAHLNGTPQDIDYLVDGKKLCPNDFLLFVTRKQAKTITAYGRKRSVITNQVASKGYKLVWIDELPFLATDIRTLIGVWVRSFSCVFAPLFPTADVFQEAWQGFLRFSPLFNHAQAKACLYLKIPNGQADWRRDTAVLTGLCRQAGIISAGCQTRVIYGPLYEFAFDCYDINFCWGSAWYYSLQPALKHVKKMIDVGCQVLDLLIPALARLPSERSDSGRRVLIFTGDVAGSHYTFDYNISFLDACLILASSYPGDTFSVKVKDPGHADRFMSDDRLSHRLSQCPHFKFIKRPRHDYVELLASADIVLAIGFTTPGTEALLLGKPAIYYSELRSGGEAYRTNPLWVARTAEELKISYKTCRDLDVTSRNGLDELDAYRDGRTRERILTTLLAC
ncbi:MAG TPA: hypothetical protein VK717_06570 [Opitutaceae bacterium]|jgi:hypothetical protein|nr:hypothetical protein [Opitutaceae bacterium]